MGIGTGYGFVKTEGNLSGENVSGTFGGAGPAVELLIGGTVSAGFVVGGGVLGQYVWDPDLEPMPGSGVGADNPFFIGLVGPFIDWFPVETGGTHFGVMPGLGSSGLQRDNALGASVWGGYDFWISNQWSLGAELRATGMRGKRDIVVFRNLSTGLENATFEQSAGTVQLLFTALLH
jgi:hypothetical protein